MKTRIIIGLTFLTLSCSLITGCNRKNQNNNSVTEESTAKETVAVTEPVVEEEIQELPQEIQQAIQQETREVMNVDAIPKEYLVSVKKGGRVIPISYPSKDYFGDGGDIT